VISVEGADVKTSSGHGPGMHRGVLDHVVGEVARGILATAVLDGMADEVEVVLLIYIKRWNGPVGLGMLGLFFHSQNLPVVIDLDDTRALELLDGGLLVAHDAARAFLLGEVYELLEGEEEEVVGGDDEKRGDLTIGPFTI